MAYETKPNEGALFKNNERRTDRDANARGSAVVVCPHCQKESSHWVSAWTNPTKAGDKYQKLKFKAKDAESEPSRPQDAGGVIDPDIPFAVAEHGSVA